MITTSNAVGEAFATAAGAEPGQSMPTAAELPAGPLGGRSPLRAHPGHCWKRHDHAGKAAAKRRLRQQARQMFKQLKAIGTPEQIAEAGRDLDHLG